MIFFRLAFCVGLSAEEISDESRRITDDVERVLASLVVATMPLPGSYMNSQFELRIFAHESVTQTRTVDLAWATFSTTQVSGLGIPGRDGVPGAFGFARLGR